MPSHKQPTDYYMITYGFDGKEPIVETFFSTEMEEMSQPEIYGMTWYQVQKVLHKHYKDLSNMFEDIAEDWLTKSEDEYFLPPETNQKQMDLWNNAEYEGEEW